MTRQGFVYVFAAAFAILLGMFWLLPAAGVYHIGSLLTVGMAITIVIAFSRAIGIVITTKGKLPPGYILAVGITTQWIGTVLRQSSHYFSLDTSTTLAHTMEGATFIVFTIGLWLSLAGGFTILFAVGDSDESHEFPTKTFLTLGVVIAAIALIIGGMMYSVTKLHADRHIKFPQWCQDCHAFPRKGD
jgi:hypothetical protein